MNKQEQKQHQAIISILDSYGIISKAGAITDEICSELAELRKEETPDVNSELLEQLDTWIAGCEKSANDFHVCKMEFAEMGSSSMAIAYKNVKQLIEKQKP